MKKVVVQLVNEKNTLPPTKWEEVNRALDSIVRKDRRICKLYNTPLHAWDNIFWFFTTERLDEVQIELNKLRNDFGILGVHVYVHAATAELETT